MDVIDLSNEEKLQKMTQWKNEIYSLGAAIVCKIRDDKNFNYEYAANLWDDNRKKIDDKYKIYFNV